MHRNTRVRPKDRKSIRVVYTCFLLIFELATSCGFIWHVCKASISVFMTTEGVALTAVVLISRWVIEQVKFNVHIRQTSADPLLLPWQDSRSVDDTDALQDWVRHLGTHEPAKKIQGRERVSTGHGGEKEKVKEREMQKTSLVTVFTHKLGVKQTLFWSCSVTTFMLICLH